MVNILLDLDGVLCNWEKATCDLFDLDWHVVMKNWPKGEFEIEAATGITEDDIWERIDAAGEDWWANLDEYPWARKLYDECLSLADTYFVTSPSYHPSSLAGKLTWMSKFTGQDRFRNYMVGPKKFLCARHNQILIDDSDRHIGLFRSHGGFGVLFPRHNNSGWNIVGEPEEVALDEVRSIIDLLGRCKSTGL